MIEPVGTSTGNDQKVIQEVTKQIKKSWSELQRWVERHQGGGLKCCWIKYSNADTKGEIGWARTNSSDVEGKLIISSLRDVADEAALAEKREGDSSGYHAEDNASESLAQSRFPVLWERQQKLPDMA